MNKEASPIASVISGIFNSINPILRYVLSGFVVLAVAWAVDTSHTVLANMRTSVADSWWPILLLAPVLGTGIYSLHLLFYFPSYGILAYWLALRYNAKGERQRRPTYSEAWHALLAEQHRHWKWRVSEKTEERAAQDRLDSWSANVHFRYCSVYALILTPIVMYCMGLSVALLWPILAGCVLFSFNFYDNFRLSRGCILVDTTVHTP